MVTPAFFFFWNCIHLTLLPLLFQAAADFAKTHLPEALRQQLLIYARERERDRDKDREKSERKERSGLSYPSILEQQILNVDKEMLDKLSASYNEAGMCVLENPANIVVRCKCSPHEPQRPCVWVALAV